MKIPAPAPRGRRLALPAAAVLSLAALATTTTGPPASAAPVTPAAGSVAADGGATFYDARQPASRQAQSALDLQAARATADAPVSALRAALGGQALVDVDPTTLTPRNVARLDGFLTGPSAAPAADVALGYVRAQAGVFRLGAADLAALRLTRTYVDVEGTTHLSWAQTAGGTPLFGNGLKASVAKDGSLVNVQGSPVPGLRAPAAPAALDADAAITRAKADLRAPRTAPSAGDTATSVLFATTGGSRAAYQVVTMSVARPALSVVDAQTGRVMFRQSLTSDAAAPETATVFRTYPGAAEGGAATAVDLTAPGWLPAGARTLTGNNAHTYSDVNDDNAPSPSEEVGPNAQGTYTFAQQRFAPAGQPCTTYVCTWDPATPGSWKVNRKQTATQNFYLVNSFHDHLAQSPIGFTEAAGNFQTRNASGQGKGGDAVLDEPLDGAATAGQLPDGRHLDNANFATPPDGTAPRMQMYLFHAPGATYPAQDPFLAVSGSDEADVVHHEYTHGLSHRLVVDAGNVPALDSQQGGSMGEAWSDWYAFDHLVAQGLVKDTAAPGEVLVGDYVSAGGRLIRTESIDCTVGAPASVCPGAGTAGSGGYTYGDFGKIYAGGPEVHADGEIWAQTLWDLRTALGTRKSESLVTRAMELSPVYPSYLDMRNAILQADTATRGGADLATIWKTFAHRGMGFFAGTVTGNDVAPVEDFSMPPAAGAPKGTVTGRVRDSVSGRGVAGAVVAFGGHDSGFPGSYAAVSDRTGGYTISGVVAGTYPDVYSGGAGYNGQVRTASVSSGRTDLGFSLVRDWAAASGGATVAATNGDDGAAYGCGAGAMVDQALTNGWSTARPTSGGKYVTVALPTAVDVETLQIDPTGTCGDDLTASAAGYTLETSEDGTTFRRAAAGTFATPDAGHLVTVPLAAGTGTAVTAIRYTILTNQTAARGADCPGAAAGCAWFDSREMEVFGSAS